ncbi:MAG: hypothetical protein ACRBG0_00720 [Lewinella sp.]|uniref:hypothetical protein n=1 Tax=Lewinella sp. TaxID=2004506 RepID=UPI003D6BB643
MLTDNVDAEILTSVISVQSFYQTLVTSALAIGIGIAADYYGIGLVLFSISLVLILGNLAMYRK